MDEQLRERIVRGFSENVPHNRALGITIIELSRACAILELPYDERLIGNPETRVLHGGAVAALLDGCSGSAVFAALAIIVPIATLDLRIDYLRPATPDRAVRARAECYRQTKHVAFTRAVAYHDDPSEPIASSAGTFMMSTKIGKPKAATS
jgi:uncharacterized protein (TIGR00369 family)